MQCDHLPSLNLALSLSSGKQIIYEDLMLQQEISLSFTQILWLSSKFSETSYGWHSTDSYQTDTDPKTKEMGGVYGFNLQSISSSVGNLQAKYFRTVLFSRLIINHFLLPKGRNSLSFCYIFEGVADFSAIAALHSPKN